ncbi:MAG: hypothetical protein MUD03_03880 [Pirellula sp.]|jgi:hypothetical protein|nr:hypothetical protein [Pirellula sp.]
MRLTILFSTFLAICFLSSPIVAAQESVERLREKAMAVREEAKAAAESGEKRRAAELEKESMKLLENAERMARQTKEKDSHHTDRMHDHGPKPDKKQIPDYLRPHAEKMEIASQRIHHLRVAAEHLKLAEAHDLAHQLMEKADVMEREVQEGKRRLAEEMHKQRGEPEGMGVVQDLRVEVAKLRAEIKELRAKLMNRDE